ncbi:MAG: hypothetical protein KBB54_00715 [Candidatus Pacebacteria bacterium]|nr:hypothetical protein [Candidatus Paceibacterota bacterium]MBP9818552.1 hypothetical protein [Candidatus Paceibacterota bacterium]
MFKSKRALVNIVLFGSFIFVPFLPWYIPFAIGIVAAWYLSYYEFIALGFLMDVFFASRYMSAVSDVPLVAGASFILRTFFFTLITAGIVFVLQMIKKRVRFYS